MVRTARLHYDYRLTHEKTAASLGVLRVKVTRMLKEAREAGIVRITVVTDMRPFAELEVCARSRSSRIGLSAHRVLR